MQNHQQWVEKYRPVSFKDYIVQDESIQKLIDKTTSNKSFPHLLLTGVQGTGKTTLVQLLLSTAEVYPEDIRIINASDENSVDMVRDIARTFATTFPVGTFKVVVFEEADQLTVNAQNVLKMVMETHADNLRFIFTSNREHKLIPPLKSRCQHYRFKKSDPNDIAMYVANVLTKEKVSFDLDTLDKFVAIGYPDIRKTINLVQQHTSEGILHPATDTEGDADYRNELLDLIEAGNWVQVRKTVCPTVTGEEWEEVYRFLYDNIHKCPTFAYNAKWDDAIIQIAEYLYRHTICSDPEINFAALAISLGQISKD